MKKCFFLTMLCTILNSGLLLFALDSGVKNKDSFFVPYESRTWKVSDGLPGSTITDIIQDDSGYLYIGTYEGLVRFDGIEFQTMSRGQDEKYEFSSARSLFKDSSGKLWVGSNDEGIFCLHHNGKIDKYTTADGLPNNSIRSISEDENGDIWCGTASGIACISKLGRVFLPKGLEKTEIAQMLITCLYCDSAGRMWVCGQGKNSLYCYMNSNFVRYDGIKSFPNPVVTCLTQDKNGAFYFGVTPHFAVKIDGASEEVFDVGRGRGTVINSIFQDSNSVLWFAMDSGISVLQNGTIQFYDEENGLTNNSVNKITEDKEGTIWLCTDRGGIECLRRGRFRTQNFSSAINSIAEDPLADLIWLGGDDGLYCMDSSMNLVENEYTRLYSNVRVRHVEFTKNGDLLVSTYEKFGQLRLCRDGKILFWTQVSGLTGNKVRVATEVSDGSLYIGTTTGLNIVSPSGTISTYRLKDGIPNEYIMCITEMADGSVWVGTDGGGIFVLRNGKISEIYNTENGLSGNVIFKILEFSEDEIWICTGTGLCRFKDKQFSIVRGAGFGTDSIFQIIPDYTGMVWMTSNRGISNIRLNDLEDVADGKTKNVSARFFSHSDGIHSGGVNSTSLSLCDSLGRLWFTLIDGVAVYDPVKATENKLPPPVQIKDVIVDNDSIPFVDTKILLSPDSKRLTILFTGLSFVSSEQMRFSYCLEGFDKGFTDWSQNRQVSYTNLKPGTYTFSVIAENSDGIHGFPSDPLVIIKKPHFWQLWYFWFTIGFFVVFTILSIILLRFRRMQKYQRKLELEVERQTHTLKEQAQALKEEKIKSENLLLNILPRAVKEELEKSPGKTIADYYDCTTVLFADIVGFTQMASGLDATEIVRMLNELFSRFDNRAVNCGVEKIKTIGDAYMAACGFEEGNAKENAVRLVNFAKGMLTDIEEFNKENAGVKLQMRIGINSGSVVAGVIGRTKFIYDIWGDTVNVANRMESSGSAGKIHLSESTYVLVKDNFTCEGPFEHQIKGKGKMSTYFLA